MNLNFKILCSVAALMCSVPAVFGMQEGKMSFSDESAKSYSGVRLIEVNADPKLSDKQELEKDKSASQERESAQKDVKHFGWLYNRVKRATQNILTRVIKPLGVSNQENADEVIIAEPYVPKSPILTDDDTSVSTSSDFSVSTYQEVLRENTTEYKNKSSIAKLKEWCEREDTRYSLSDLRFDFKISNGKFNCILLIGNKEYEQESFYERKREAKNAIAEYALKELSKMTDQEVLRENTTEHNDIQFCCTNSVQTLDKFWRKNNLHIPVYGYVTKGIEYNCILRIGSETFDPGVYYKDASKAQYATAEYALKKLNKMTDLEALKKNTNECVSPVSILQKFCQKNNLGDPKFERESRRGMYRFIVRIGDKKFDPEVYYENNREAKLEIAEYALKELSPTADQEVRKAETAGCFEKSPTVKLYELAKKRGFLNDIKRDFVPDGEEKVNCILQIGNEEFKQDISYKSKKEAKNAIDAYALKILKERESANQASSSDSNQKK